MDDRRGEPKLAQAFCASFQEVRWIVLAYLLALITLIVSIDGSLTSPAAETELDFLLERIGLGSQHLTFDDLEPKGRASLHI
jgi:hypothetical protein